MTDRLGGTKLVQKLQFNNTRDVIPTLRSELLSKGFCFRASKGNSTGRRAICRELIGVNFEILSWQDRAEMMQENGLSTTFAEFDVLDRLCPTPVNPGKAVQVDTVGVLKDHLNPDGKLDYTYSERMWYQIPKITRVLIEEPVTRQAFISVWDPRVDINNLEVARVPCSIGFHFLRRNGKLNLVYLMRSLEVTKCLGNDIYTSSRLLEVIAERIAAETGTITFSVGSLHLFE